jgi:AraC-like DNA-binding protein
MRSHPTKDCARYWRVPELGDLELLKATYVNHTFPRHMHDTYVFGIVLDGVEEFYCNGQTHVAPAGSVAIVNPGDVHTGNAGRAGYWRYRTLYPSVEQVLKAIGSDWNGSFPVFSANVIRDAEIGKAMRRFHKLLETEGITLESESLYAWVLAELVQRYAVGSRSFDDADPGHVAVRRAREYLLDNLSENISIDELAQVAGLSPYHLIHSFTKAVGLPPHRFLINARIELAKRLLREGLSITDVAFQTGFLRCGVMPGRYAAV